ncbi:MAG TPA: hypothetical protein VLG76_01595 [Rhabdochlamydiaceae bacterium]|nr:hypothetical protein [Rhabdochlamydiaceae bacterium]HSX38874.1 hypothetical protein [Chlamydiales bacterium]
MNSKNSLFHHRLSSKQLDDLEWKTIDSLEVFCKEKGTEYLREQACKENAFLLCQGAENLNYRFSKTLHLDSFVTVKE